MNLSTYLLVTRGAKLDAEDRKKFGKLSASETSTGYIVVYTGKTAANKSGLTRLHRLVINAPVDMEVDHINGNKLDNSKDNLRLATRQNNSRNVAAKGYSKCKTTGKYRAFIKLSGKSVCIGSFKTEKDASEAYKSETAKQFGEFQRQTSC